MTGGATDSYTTNGQFDLAKWKKVLNTYNKTTIKNAVATAVMDGTLIGNQLIDEPETKRWGTVLTKALIDQMAVYAKTIFPTLPMGVNHAGRRATCGVRPSATPKWTMCGISTTGTSPRGISPPGVQRCWPRPSVTA